MGAWGTGLYSGDFAMDLRGTIRAVARLPFSADRLVDVLCDAEPGAARSSVDSDHTVFWLVVADQFAKRGIDSPRVRETALSIIDEGRDRAAVAARGIGEPDLPRRGLRKTRRDPDGRCAALDFTPAGNRHAASHQAAAAGEAGLGSRGFGQAAEDLPVYETGHRAGGDRPVHRRWDESGTQNPGKAHRGSGRNGRAADPLPDDTGPRDDPRRLTIRWQDRASPPARPCR